MARSKRRAPKPRRSSAPRKAGPSKGRAKPTRKRPGTTRRVIPTPSPRVDKRRPAPAPKPARKPTPKPARKPTPKPARKPTPTPKRKPPRKYLPIPKAPRGHRPVVYKGGEAIVTPIVPAGQGALRIEERVQWRTRDGKLAKPRSRGARKYVTVVQVDRSGKVLRVIDKETPHMVLKTVIPSKIGDFEREGKYQGRIFTALIDASVTSKLHQPNVTRVEVMMRWQDERGKAYREKLSLNVEHLRKRRQFPAALAGLIIETLRDRGYRTQYTVQLFKEARAKGLKHPITWEDWRKLVVARNLSIVVTVYTR